MNAFLGWEPRERSRRGALWENTRSLRGVTLVPRLASELEYALSGSLEGLTCPLAWNSEGVAFEVRGRVRILCPIPFQDKFVRKR